MPIKTGMFMASGNKSTCAAQGTILLMTHSSMISYYSILSLFSFLAIRNNFEEAKLRRYEPFFHLISFGFPFALSVYGAEKKFANPSGAWCFVGRFPPRCEGKSCHHDNIQGYIFVCLFAATFCLLFATMMIICTYLYEKRSRKASLSLRGKNQLLEKFRKNKVRVIRQQTGLYIISLFVTFGLGTIARAIQAKRRAVHFPTMASVTIMVPFQGLIMAIVYEFTRLKQLNSTTELVADIQNKSSSRNTTVVDMRSSIKSNSNANKDEVDQRRKSDTEVVIYSIFDGERRPSSMWAEFIFEEDKDDNSIGDNIDFPDTGKSNLEEKQFESEQP